MKQMQPKIPYLANPDGGLYYRQSTEFK